MKPGSILLLLVLVLRSSYSFSQESEVRCFNQFELSKIAHKMVYADEIDSLYKLELLKSQNKDTIIARKDSIITNDSTALKDKDILIDNRDLKIKSYKRKNFENNLLSGGLLITVAFILLKR